MKSGIRGLGPRPSRDTFRAPAKINLTLEVLGRREDGYHGIRSVMVPLELADTIAIEPCEELVFDCEVRELAGEENLALRALRAIEAATRRPLGARVTLHKAIPTQAGLGGGSSDAAAILRAAMEGTLGVVPALDWLEIARGLGSDVPFFLVAGAALVEGTGERVTALGAVPAWPVLVVKPPAQVVTAQAYAALDERKLPGRPRSESLSLQCAQALQHGDFDGVQNALGNDFHELALDVPSIRHAYDALRAAGAAKPLIAGSGSCLFVLARDAAERDALHERLRLSPEFEVFATAFARDDAWREASARA